MQSCAARGDDLKIIIVIIKSGFIIKEVKLFKVFIRLKLFFLILAFFAACWFLASTTALRFWNIKLIKVRIPAIFFIYFFPIVFYIHVFVIILIIVVLF